MFWADNVRVMAIFAVIVLHTSSTFVYDIGILDAEYGGYNWWAGNIYDSATRWCVPVFVILSGYLLLNREESISKFFGKRLKRIFLPIFFWSVFFSFWTIIKLYVKGDVSDATVKIINNLISGNPYYHLWYVFMIPFIYVFTPALRVLFAGSKKNELKIFIFFSFSLSMLSVAFYKYNPPYTSSLFTNDFIIYIAYFCFGGFLGKYNSFDNNKIFVVLFFSSLLITVIGSYYFTYYYFYSYLSFNVVLMSISVFILSRNNLNCKFFFSKYAQFSFGVYLIHPIFLDVINFSIKDLLLLYMNAYVYVPTVSFVVMVLSLNTIRVIFGNKHLYKYV